MRLFHISEEDNIKQFIPRVSKAIWNFEKYVWAIHSELLHHYLLPRACPRICIKSQDASILSSYTDVESKYYLVIPINWRIKIDDSILFKYEFDPSNFKLIDEIAGYYVSKDIEIPINKLRLEACSKELDRLNVGLVFLERDDLEQLKDRVIEELTDFSIIRWSNLERD